MPAKRPETRTGSRNAAPRRAAAAGWWLGAACLILCAAPSVGRAAPVPAKPAPATASKPSAPPTTSASKSTVPSASSASKPAPAAQGKMAAESEGSTGASANPRSATDSTFGARDAGAGGASPGARPASSASTPAAAKSSRPVPVPVTTVTPARPPRAPAGTTPTGPTPARLANAGRTRGVQTVAHLDQKMTYQYNALGRRDPFQPMIGGEFVGVDVGGDAPVDVGGMKVVGIVWGTEDKFAMAEDGRGQSLVLRVGDKVMNGVVESLRRDAVVVRITVDGQTQTVAIPLTRKGDKSNATR